MTGCGCSCHLTGSSFVLPHDLPGCDGTCGTVDALLCLLCGKRGHQIGVCCTKCRDNLNDKLHEIPELYGLLGYIVLPGAGADEKSFTKVKRDAAPLPGRGDVMNLHGPSNPGDGGPDPYEDNHGPLPTLEALHTWERLIREERNLPAPDPLAQLAPWLAKQLEWARAHRELPLMPQYLGWVLAGLRRLPELRGPSVAGVCKFLRKHLDWACEQQWVDEFKRDVNRIRHALQDVCGEHRPKPIGKCPALVGLDDDQVECGEDLYAPLYSTTIKCDRCHAEWPEERWLLLGAGLPYPQADAVRS